MTEKVLVTFNNVVYTAIYNEQTDYYEIDLEAPDVGGIYETTVDYSYIDTTGEELYSDTDVMDLQVFAKEEITLDLKKVFMWIFSYSDFSVKDIVEISDYEIVIDEETNSTSTIKVLKETSAKAKDIIAVKINNEVVYWGIIKEIQNDSGSQVYEFVTNYITNLFDQDIILENEDLITTDGVEDFIADSITNNFIENEDTFVNLSYLEVKVNSHTKIQISVDTDNNIFNLHTWTTNCTQNYDIVYSFSIVEKKFVMSIECKDEDTKLIDTTAQSISEYSEVFETDIVSKVVVLTSTDTYTLFLLADKTTTTDMSDENRAEGKTVTIYTEKYEDAEQKALDEIKSNSYNHNITFKLSEYIKIGTPIAIKTKNSTIYDTYISAVTITSEKFYQYTCGTIRINFIDKLLKERN